jgi:hypothetical protein
MNVSILVFGVYSLQNRTSLLWGMEPEAANMMRRALIRLISF